MAKFQEFIKAHSLFTDFDINLFRAGTHYKLYEKLGSHLLKVDKAEGTYFAVWAPSASQVSVIGDFNYWNGEGYELNARWDSSGIWEGFIPNVQKGQAYKYKITNTDTGEVLEKGDPFAKKWEVPPKTASVVWEIDDYSWKDKTWMNNRQKKNALDAPMSVYEVHMGSWKRGADHNSLSYKQLATELVDYVKELGYTHVEFMPVMEHPFFGSWGLSNNRILRSNLSLWRPARAHAPCRGFS